MQHLAIQAKGVVRHSQDFHLSANHHGYVYDSREEDKVRQVAAKSSVGCRCNNFDGETRDEQGVHTNHGFVGWWYR